MTNSRKILEKYYKFEGRGKGTSLGFEEVSFPALSSLTVSDGATLLIINGALLPYGRRRALGIFLLWDPRKALFLMIKVLL